MPAYPLNIQPQPSLCELQGLQTAGHSAHTIGSLGWQRLFARHRRIYLQSNSCRQVGAHSGCAINDVLRRGWHGQQQDND